MKGNLLIISDDEKTVSVFTGAPNVKVASKKGLQAGLKAVSGSEVILLDLPDAVHALREIRSYSPEAVVIVMAARDDLRRAFEEGAWSFIEKPPGLPATDDAVLRHSVRNALGHLSLKQALSRHIEPPQMVAKSPAMMKVMRLIEKSSLKDAPVLISGEAGTGKSIVARSIHCLSRRKTGPFVIADAVREVPEALGRAEGGSIHIKRCKPETLGGLYETTAKSGCNVRLLLGIEGEAGIDNQHGALSIKLPPLRGRKEDISALLERFLGAAEGLFGGGKKSFSPNARRALLSNNWPGNVSELENVVNKAYILAEGPQIGSRHLCLGDAGPILSVKEFLDGKLKKYLREMTELGNSRIYDTVVSEVEKALIELALRETGGNQIRAAKTLGMNRNTLRAKIKGYKIGVTAPRDRPRAGAKQPPTK